MKTIATFNALHLGDNLVTLHFLRALAKANPQTYFYHYAPEQYLAQLYPIWQDLPNLAVCSIALVPQGAYNTWCGSGGWWYCQPDTTDWLATYTRWLDHLAAQMGLANPLRQPTDFLFDYPALQRVAEPIAFHGVKRILVINSPPQSNQASGYSLEAFDNLIRQLDAAGHAVITTHPSMVDDIPCTQARGLDVTAIGRLSQTADAIVGVSTGPMWTTFNVWNRDSVKLRLFLCDRERVDMLPTVVSANSLTLFPEILQDHGLI